MSKEYSAYATNTAYTIEKILRPLVAKYNNAKLNNELDFYEEKIAPSTSEYIQHLAKQARAIQFVEFYSDDREDEFDRIFGGAEDKAWRQTNTYNYNEPWSDIMSIVLPQNPSESGAYTIAFAPHYGGDARANYGDYIVLTFDNMYDFYDIQMEFLDKSAYTFELDGKNYTCEYNGGETFRLTGIDNDFDDDGFYPEPHSEEDFLDSARQAIAEGE